MSRFLSYHKSVSVVLIFLSFLIIATPISRAFAQQQATQQEPDAAFIMMQAQNDARQDQSGFGYGVGGFFCGIFGWLFALLSNPDVPAARLLGKSSNYVVIYTDAYKDEAKSIRTRSACIGWAIGTGVSVLLWAVAGEFSSSSQ